MLAQLILTNKTWSATPLLLRDKLLTHYPPEPRRVSIVEKKKRGRFHELPIFRLRRRAGRPVCGATFWSNARSGWSNARSGWSDARSGSQGSGQGEIQDCAAHTRWSSRPPGGLDQCNHYAD